MRTIKRVSLGIKGLDKLIEGGVPEGSTILLTGSPGTGKTIFSIQFLVHGAMNKENGLYISMEEDVNRLKHYLEATFAWPLEKLEEEKKLLLLRTEFFDYEKFKLMLETNVEKIEAKRLVIDPITTLSLFFERPLDIRRSLLDLDRLLKKLGCTTLLTCEVPEGSSSISSFGIEEFTSDGIIILKYYVGNLPRSLVIRKMRATEHSSDEVPFEIKRNVGIIVKNVTKS
ncbi:MAG: ATPase domain-containing protein [Candidatus Aenigmarchaeota archaeon]|nr:AAA family ATPase [Candidatus Aenigmarchaeota archaeon]MDW8149050.1 ATPase domain-containing protein [Candidatus Aenigmarchaeota archaeon]